MKLKEFINETWIGSMPIPKDDTDVEEYVNDFHNLILQKIKFIGKWKSLQDKFTGIIEWSNPNGLIAMATPFWEMQPEIPINVIDFEGNELLDQTIKFKPTYDKKKDLKRYEQIISKKLKSLDKHLTK